MKGRILQYYPRSRWSIRSCFSARSSFFLIGNPKSQIKLNFPVLINRCRGTLSNDLWFVRLRTVSERFSSESSCVLRDLHNYGSGCRRQHIPFQCLRSEKAKRMWSSLSDLESLPHILQKKYALIRDLDRSLQEIVRQNEQHCEEEIEEIKRGVKAGTITPGTSNVRFSDEALDEQEHSIRIADEKVALAVQAYDLVDAHIQQLDQYLKKSEEEQRRERENAAMAALNASSVEGGTKSGREGGSGRGGRKKTRQAAAAAAAATEAVAGSTNASGIDLDIPVDPNEPTYCICNQVSYGEMIACDNPTCTIEWFHFGCVGLKEQPKGKWYCPDCAALKNRRKGR